MAKNYTETEIKDAVANLVRSSIRRQVGALGNRKTGVTFSDTQDAAAGVFILNQDAPYYVVSLACGKLNTLVDELTDVLTDLADSVQALKRYVPPIKQTTSLNNARTALNALNSAASKRTSILKSIEDVPAYKRFESATTQFLSENKKAVKVGGNIVRTPTEAKGELATLVSSLSSKHTVILAKALLIQNALSTYDSLQLSNKLSQSILDNSTKVIGNRCDELNGLTPEERLKVIRAVTLDVLTVKAVVKGFTSLSSTTSVVYLNGTSAPYADAQHPATPASILTDIPGPYAVTSTTNKLNLRVDNAYDISINLPVAYTPYFESYRTEDYGIGSSDNNKFFIQATGYPKVTVNLAADTQTTAKELVTQINTALGSQPVEAVIYGPKLYFRSAVSDISVVSSSTRRFTAVLGTNWGSIDGYTVAVGDWVEVIDALNSSNKAWYKVSNVSGLPAYFDAVKEGSTTGTNESGVTLNINQGGRGVRIQYKDSYVPTALANKEGISLPIKGDKTVEVTLQTLGFTGGIEAQASGIRTKDLVQVFNASPSIAVGGTARVRAAVEFTGVISGRVRTTPVDNTLVTFSKLETTCDILFGGGNAHFTNFGDNISEIEVGDILVIRDSIHSGEINNWGTIYSIAGGTIAAHMNEVVDNLETGISVEFGPDLRALDFPAILTISNTPRDTNDGSYEVLALEGGILVSGEITTPIGCVLSRGLPEAAGLGATTKYFQATIGNDQMRLSSTSTGVTTYLEVLASSTVGSLLWASLPKQSSGVTEWLSVPEAPSRVSAGDLVELRDTNEAKLSRTLEVLSTVTGPNLLRVSPSIDTTSPTWGMSASSSAPKGLIRKKQKNNFETLRLSLVSWRASDTNRTLMYYGELRKMLNTLHASSNPSLAVINDALAHLQELSTAMSTLKSALNQYTAARVVPVDTLITTYLQQGGQRAVDILVSADFAGFFGLKQDEMSYSGTVRATMKEVAAKDLPQRKVNRRAGGQSVGSWEDVDYEYDLSDATESEVTVKGNISEHKNSAF